jgi:alditol oxidase
VQTATHGSGDANGNLATAVAGLEIVTSDGELLTVERGDEDFNGLVVGLGALGAVTRVTLDVEPAYEVRQRVFEGLRWDALYENFDAIMSSGHSVSIFTRWGKAVDQVWVRGRVSNQPDVERAELFGARAATLDRHPILGIDPVNCTSQLGVPGPWSDRLPHFRMGFTPRMSPQYRRDSVGVHFTWRRDQAAVQRALAQLEVALSPFSARPHWGKLFVAHAATIASLYPRHADFARLVDRLDARQAFRNAWLERHVLGAFHQGTPA